MERPETPRTEEMPEVEVDAVRPLIVSFFGKISVGQWLLIKRGEPDDATRVLLAEMLLELITCVSKAVFQAVTPPNSKPPALVSEEYVLASVGSALTLSFAEFLSLEDEVPCASLGLLSNLIVKEVAENVNSALSSGVCPEECVLSRVTPPCTLNAAVGHACKVLHAIRARVMLLQRPKPLWHRADRDRPRPNGDAARGPVEPGGSEKDTSVQDIISKEVNAITTPLLKDVPNFKYHLLQCASSQEIKNAAEGITRLLSSVSLKRPRSLTRKRCKLGLRGALSKVKTCLARQFIKAMIHRLVADLRVKFHHDPKAESKRSVRLFMAKVNALLLKQIGGKQAIGNDFGVFWKFKYISSGKAQEFTQELCDLLYSHIASRSTPKMICVPMRQRANMYTDIQYKVNCCLGLMGWWLNTQAGSYNVRVMLALTDPGLLEMTQFKDIIAVEEKASLAAATVFTSVPSAEPEPAQSDREMSVRTLVQKLVWRTLTKAKVSCTTGHSEAIIRHVSEKTWAEVQDMDFDSSPDAFRHLDKAVLKELRKEWGCTEKLLTSMRLKEPAVEKQIAASLKKRLKKPKEPRTKPRLLTTVSKFFSSVGNAFSNTFRRRHRVGVI